MEWTQVFEKKEQTKTVYESHLWDNWLNTKPIKNETKKVYTSYRDRFVEWFTDNDIEIPTKEDCEKYLIYKKDSSNVKQARQRYAIFNEYFNWLVTNHILSDNVWKKIDLVKLGLTYSDEAKGNKKKKAVKEKKEVFTLSDVAELLLAIEDEDTDTITRILYKVSEKK